MLSDARKHSHARSNCKSLARLWGVLVLVIGSLGPRAGAQVFDSGSDGSDGPLDLSCPSPPCTILFDPVELGIDADRDNVFHFTTITIPAGLTLHLRALELNFAPVYWLSTGAVQIDGTIDLSGANGHDGVPQNRAPSMPGPGGFPGGAARSPDASDGTFGFGPGGGSYGYGCGHTTAAGRGGSYATDGQGQSNRTYGNLFLLPLVGGSGGGTSRQVGAFVGGAGGGALLIASDVSIAVDGTINANGGAGGCCCANNGCASGGGSGGAIRLLAPLISGTGSITASWETRSWTCHGGEGRFRAEAFQYQFTGTIDAVFRIATLSPNTIFLPVVSPAPSVRVTDVAGIEVPDPPSGDLAAPDVTIDTPEDVILTIEAAQIPPGTQVTLYLLPENGPNQVVTSTPLVGTLAVSTATASVTFPSGFSRFTVRALWEP